MYSFSCLYAIQTIPIQKYTRHAIALTARLTACILFLSLHSISADISKCAFTTTAPMTLAIHSGDLNAVESLLHCKYPPDVQLKYGNTALIQAAVHNKQEIVGMLIAHNADLELSNDFGVTPLLASIMFKHFEIARILLQHGATPLDQEPLTKAINKMLLYYQRWMHLLEQGNQYIIPFVPKQPELQDDISPRTSQYALTKCDLIFLDKTKIKYKHAAGQDSLSQRLCQYASDSFWVKCQEIKRTQKLFAALSEALPTLPDDLRYLIISFESACPLRQITSKRQSIK